MSAHNEHAAHGGHGDHHGDHDDGAPHATVKGYLTGFILSLILTAIPFWIVMDDVFRKPSVAVVVVLLFAVVQIVVHMFYFLHLNSSSESGWTMMSLIFTVVLLVIALTGSLWIMNHLDHNMMPPMTPQQARNLP